ncbi:MAG: acyl-CoA thioesterase [Bryobacteraceae bacterium]
MQAHEIRLRARYAETDQMGVVHHANYLVWMEAARVEFSKACGFDYREMEECDGVLMVVAEARCRYSHPARFDDEVVVRISTAQVNTRMVRFHYEMRRADGLKLASGETAHVFCRRDLKPCRMPDKYRKNFGLPPAEAGAAQ